jgi:hypothetical protein
MAVSSADVRVIVERVCTRPDVLDAYTRRDLGAVISALGSAGVTQGQISALTGVSQGRLSEWRTGKREPKGVSTFQRFADGVRLPAAARRALGLDPAAVTLAVSWFSAVAEATLLVAWMTYDSAPTSGMAQGYFVQALSLAQAGSDRLLGGSILDAMSHQATFAGRFTDAANLARAALAGTRGVAPPTLTAHFHAMEARALARLGDAKSCSRALSESVTEFDRANPEDAPAYMQYFNESELSAEFGHCMRDLGRACDAARYADSSLKASEAAFGRSDFFVSLVLADAHLAAGDAEQACAMVLRAISSGDQIGSARCVSYLREFVRNLPANANGPIAAFREEAGSSRLWRIASRPDKSTA